VDYERLTAAAFALATANGAIDSARLRTALDCWKQYSSPAPFERRLTAEVRKLDPDS
jgi:hypothetical protein